MIGSPGTGVQQRASLTHRSSTPLTTTPGSPLRSRRGDRRVGVVDLGEVLGRALLAAERLHQPADHGLRRDVALADRGVERGHVGVAQLGGQRDERLVRSSAAGSAGSACAWPCAIASLPCSMASSRRSLENHCRILLRARGLFTNISQSRLGPAVRGLRGEDLDHVAVVQRALQRHQPAVDPAADAVRWPTSVCTA